MTDWTVKFRSRNDMLFPRILSLCSAFLVIFLPLRSHAGMAPGNYKFEGTGYFYYDHSLGNGARGQHNAFDFSRMYFGIKYQISETFLARYLTDVSHKDNKGQLETLAKYAYLDWDLKKNGAHLLLGLQGTNNWKAPEEAWGARVIQYAPMEMFGNYWGEQANIYEGILGGWVDSLTAQGDADQAAKVAAHLANFKTASRSKMGSSADLGVGLRLEPSTSSYLNVMIRNGLGYKKAEDDIYKNIQVRGGVYLADKKIHISIYAEIEPWKGVDLSGNEKRYTNLQWDLLVSMEQKGKFTAAMNVNSKTFPDDFDDITATCYAAYGTVNVYSDKVKVLARADFYKSGFDGAKLPGFIGANQVDATLFIVGVDIKPDKNVRIIPNVQVLNFEDDDTDAESDLFVHLEFKF